MFANSAIFLNKNLRENWQKHVIDRWLEPLFLYKSTSHKKENNLIISTAIVLLFCTLKTNSAGSRIWYKLLNAGLNLDMPFKKIISLKAIF